PNWSPDPLVAVARPAANDLRVRVHNWGSTAIALSAIHVRGSDWGSFTILDAENPHEIPAGDHVELHLRADTTSFTLHDADGHASSHRDGRARLDFVAHDGSTLALPLRFEGQPHDALGWAPWLRLGALLFGLALLARRTRWARALGRAVQPIVALGLAFVFGSMLWSHPLCTQGWSTP